jgi:3-oxoacyl-[acyl-carrier-protein] synthase II
VLAEITGIGWVTAASMGCGKDYDDFLMTDGRLPDISHESVFHRDYPSFRRLDEYSRLGLVAIGFALRDAGIDEWKEKKPIGMIASTESGCLLTDIAYFDGVLSQKGIGASPALFSYTLPNSFLGEAAIRFGLTGTTFVITEEIPLGTACLQTALECIALREADRMLCGVCNTEALPPYHGLNSSPPGALFFMIEKSPASGFSYGRPGLRDKGGIDFNGREVTDLARLTRMCLAGRHRDGER